MRWSIHRSIRRSALRARCARRWDSVPLLPMRLLIHADGMDDTVTGTHCVHGISKLRLLLRSIFEFHASVRARKTASGSEGRRRGRGPQREYDGRTHQRQRDCGRTAADQQVKHFPPLCWRRTRVACRARNRPSRVRSCSRLNYPSLCCAPVRLSRRRWSVIGGVLVAAVFIAVAVHAHSSRAASVLSAVTPAKGEASQLFRGSE
jgi:hypothetical protein